MQLDPNWRRILLPVCVAVSFGGLLAGKSQANTVTQTGANGTTSAAGMPGGDIGGPGGPGTNGGNGGSPAGGGNGGKGGAAFASASGANSANKFVKVSATAAGGDGGGGAAGGAGGLASVFPCNGSSSSGGVVNVSVKQYGGAGGAHTFGSTGAGGNGPLSSIGNAVTGGTSNTLTLSQEARGGVGGAGNGAAGGNGGNALSSVTTSNAGGGILDATVNALGGRGGDTSGSGGAGRGGDASAFCDVVGSINRAKATATATAGAGGVNSTFSASAARGIADATAHSTTFDGRLADANASISGREGTANALARTSNSVVSSMSLSATANTVNNVIPTSVRAYGLAGSGFESSQIGIAAHGVALPIAAEVNASLAGDPKCTAAYNLPDGKTPLVLVALNLASPNRTPAHVLKMNASASISLKLATFPSGKLQIGLLDPTSSGNDFTSLHFTITREGVIVEDRTFTTGMDAMTYFNDHALDLGPLKAEVVDTLDLTFSLDIVTSENGGVFGENFLVADVGLISLAGDYNHDGIVDTADYTVWQDTRGATGVNLNADGDGDHVVTANDFTIWKNNFGAHGGSGGGDGGNHSQGVPEPRSVLLAAIGYVLCLSPVSVRRRASLFSPIKSP